MATPAEHFEEALGHYRAGRLPLAEQSCRQVLRIDPRHSDALNLLGVLAREAGNAPLALDLIGRAIAIEPSRAAFHHNQGEVYRALGREPEAGMSLGRALWLQPDSASAHNAMGIWLFAQGAFAEAEDCFRQALRLGKDDPGTLNNLGATLLRRGVLAEARSSFERGYGRARPLSKHRPVSRPFSIASRGPIWPAPHEPEPPTEPSAELRLRLALMLPVIYQSQEDMHTARVRLESKLARLRDEDIKFHDREPMSYGPQCYLAYQGLNDRTCSADPGRHLHQGGRLAPVHRPALSPRGGGPVRQRRPTDSHRFPLAVLPEPHDRQAERGIDPEPVAHAVSRGLAPAPRAR